MAHKEKFVVIDGSPHKAWRWLVDLEATGADPSGGRRPRVLMRVCNNTNDTVRLIAAESDDPMGKPGAPQGSPRVFADMTQQEAWSLGLAMIRAATGRDLPDVD